MRSHQPVCRLGHRSEIQRHAWVPCEVAKQAGPLMAEMQGVAVQAAEGVAAGVELRRDLCDCAHADVERQNGIRTAPEGVEGQAAIGVEGSDLPFSVHAGVSAAGQRHPHGLAC